MGRDTADKCRGGNRTATAVVHDDFNLLLGHDAAQEHQHPSGSIRSHAAKFGKGQHAGSAGSLGFRGSMPRIPNLRVPAAFHPHSLSRTRRNSYFASTALDACSLEERVKTEAMGFLNKFLRQFSGPAATKSVRKMNACFSSVPASFGPPFLSFSGDEAIADRSIGGRL